MTISRFSTCDLCDAHEGDTSGAFRVLPPVFHDFGVVAPFCGAVHTLRAWEDNSRVREAVNAPGEGRVLVVDGGRLGAPGAGGRQPRGRGSQKRLGRHRGGWLRCAMLPSCVQRRSGCARWR
jgi:hypothetical protein